MPTGDEPLFPEKNRSETEARTGDPGLAGRIRTLLTGQLYGVLCTQGGGQPYGSMVAFAFSDNLTYAVFATPTATRKYRLLVECDHVALVVDNRPQYPDDMMKVEAVTATGKVRNVERGPEYDTYASLLTKRHPQLESFVKASSCALFKIDIYRFFHVTRFQEVGQWVPPTRG
jgi:nitroimidazol reductase NimA-like FMN-containing flavoprotein (pyridoxamine 5'-phosphate oxidase superfamily)